MHAIVVLFIMLIDFIVP